MGAEVRAQMRRQLAAGFCLCSSSTTDWNAVEGLLDALDAAEEERDKFAKDSDLASRLVDGYCDYRNLAIRLGAKPEQMRDRHDRELCERGIGDEWSGPEGPEVWDELEAAEERLAAVRALADEWERRWDEGQAEVVDFLDGPLVRMVRCNKAAADLRAALDVDGGGERG